MKRGLIMTFIAAVLLGLVVLYLGRDKSDKADTFELEASYLLSSDRFVDVSGARVRVRMQGLENAPVLVLVHGFTNSLESWDLWSADLSQDYRVIRYDLLGHGLTGPDEDKRYAPDERAAFFWEVIDALGIDSVSIAGNSLGGLIAWKAAALQPTRVNKIALVDAAIYDFSGVEDGPAEPPLPMKMYLKSAPMSGLKQMATFNYFNIDALTEDRLTLMQEMMRPNGQAFIDHISEFSMPDPTAQLRRIQTPTLLLWGEEDRLIPVQHAERALEELPNATLTVIPSAGHVLQEDAPDESVRAFRAFLDTGSVE